MLLKHSAQYLMARGLPGIVNFLAIALYTRMLSPDDYGRYALVVATVGLFNVFFFQWLRLALGRFLPVYLDNIKPLLNTVLASFCILVGLTGGLGLILAWLWPDPTWQKLILVAVPLLWAEAWFELNLSLSAIKLLPQRYGLISGIKAVSALAISTLLVMWGMGAYGPLLGLILGMLLSAFLHGRAEWKGLFPRISHPILSEMVRYGLPLTAAFALAFVVSSSDRFFIAWLIDERSAGLYAAAYDLGQQSLTLLMVIVNLAAYPLAVRALEQKGIEAAKEQLRLNCTLLMAVAFPATIGMVVLAPSISAVLLGASFSEDATNLLPWISLAILLAGGRAYYLDLAFQLGQHTLGQVWVVGAAALLNILLNFWWIPHYGLMGAAYATVMAYLLAFILSAALGRRVFPMSIPYFDGLKIALASALMGLLLLQSPVHNDLYMLAAQVLIGGTAYLISIGLLNVCGSRTWVLRRFTA